MSVKRLLIVALLASSVSVAESEAKRDPFAPFIGGSANNSGSTSHAGKKALTSQNLMTYNLLGILASKKGSRAIISTNSGETFIIKDGDKLGKEGGIVEKIDVDGIKVKIGEQLTELVVSNKIIPQGGEK